MESNNQIQKAETTVSNDQLTTAYLELMRLNKRAAELEIKLSIATAIRDVLKS